MGRRGAGKVPGPLIFGDRARGRRVVDAISADFYNKNVNIMIAVFNKTADSSKLVVFYQSLLACVARNSKSIAVQRFVTSSPNRPGESCAFWFAAFPFPRRTRSPCPLSVKGINVYSKVLDGPRSVSSVRYSFQTSFVKRYDHIIVRPINFVFTISDSRRRLYFCTIFFD